MKPARKARLAREREGHKKMIAPLKVGNYTLECILCGEPGPGHTFARRVKVCNGCWADTTPTERRNIRGFASRIG